MSSKILLIFAILNYARHSLSNELLCRSGIGSMTISNQTKIISSFTNKHGNNTIIVDQGSEFNFTCHTHKNTNNSKILFGSENPSDEPGYESPVSRVLRRYDLTENSIGSNTKPLLVHCDGVCQVDFLMVLSDNYSMCNNTSKNWECRIIELEKKLTSKNDPFTSRTSIQ